MQWFDHLFERSARTLAQRSSRRSVLAGLANVLAGSALLPLLPVDRVRRGGPAVARRAAPARLAAGPPAGAPLPRFPSDRVARADPAGAAKDEANTCEYWKY